MNVGVEGIVTLLLSFMFILSLKNVLRRPPKKQKQQSLKSLLNEIEEEDDEKIDDEIEEKIENKHDHSLKSFSNEIEIEDKNDKQVEPRIGNKHEKAMMKPKLYSPKKSCPIDKDIKFEDSPLRMYDDGDLFTAARSIKASLDDKHSPISKSLIQDMKSLCIMVSKHAKMLESLDSRLSMLEEKPLHSSSSFITSSQHEPTRVEMLSSPKRQNKMNIDEATRISKAAEFNVELSRSRMDNAMREAFELN